MSFSPVNYSQGDPAWKSVKIGSSSETIGHVGCAVTSVAMLVSGHGYPETPKTLNAKLKARGGYLDTGIAAIFEMSSNSFEMSTLPSKSRITSQHP